MGTQLQLCIEWGIMWEEVFKNGPSKICGREPKQILKGYGLPKTDHIPSNVLKAVFSFCVKLFRALNKNLCK